jgi:hypothetical protein
VDRRLPGIVRVGALHRDPGFAIDTSI